MAQNNSSKKVANGLVAASCAAVLAVYSAGYVRTRAAVDRFEAQAEERRAADPRPQVIEGPAEKYRLPAPPAPDLVSPAPAAAPVVREDSHAPVPVAVTSEAPTGSASATSEPALAVGVAIAEIAPPVTFAPPPPAAEIAPVALPAPAPPTPHIPAPAPAPPPPAPAPAPALHAPAWKDGTYLGWGTSRHGDIQAQVIVEGGRIQSATIAQCRTRYSCNVIAKLPPQVALRQSPDVDYVSGATQSANAFYFAVVDALTHAK